MKVQTSGINVEKPKTTTFIRKLFLQENPPRSFILAVVTANSTFATCHRFLDGRGISRWSMEAAAPPPAPNALSR
jgi:hypothetical protein